MTKEYVNKIKEVVMLTAEIDKNLSDTLYEFVCKATAEIKTANNSVVALEKILLKCIENNIIDIQEGTTIERMNDLQKLADMIGGSLDNDLRNI